MNRGGRIFVIGANCEDSLAIESIKNCDLIFVRGETARNWIKSIGLSATIPVAFIESLSGEVAPENCMSRVQKELDKGNMVAYVTQLNPIIIDQLFMNLVQQFDIGEITQYPGSRNLSEGLTLLKLKNPGTLLYVDGFSFQNSYHLPFSSAQSVLIYEPLCTINKTS